MLPLCGMSEELKQRESQLEGIEKQVYELLKQRWPSHALEGAAYLNEDASPRDQRRKASSKYMYYPRKLVKKELVLSKKVGHASIFWPLSIEKWRTIIDILHT